MRFSTLVATLLPVGAALAQNQTWIVKVGENGTLSYDPPSVQANVGDTIAFQFMAKNHTVTQSSFASPCSNLTDANGTPIGIDSGFKFVPNGTTSFPQWSFTLNNASAPLWFYCRQTGHCESGMVFAVNPTAQKTYAEFQANAMASNSTNGTSATNGTSSATNGTSSSGSPSGSSSKTSSPSASATGKPGNGAGAVRLSGAAIVMTAAGLAAGVLL